MSTRNEAASAPVHRVVGQLRELMSNCGRLPWVAEFAHINDSTNIKDADGQMVACDTEGWHGACDKHDGAVIVAAINALPALLAIAEAADRIDNDAWEAHDGSDNWVVEDCHMVALTEALSLLPNTVFGGPTRAEQIRPSTGEPPSP